MNIYSTLSRLVLSRPQNNKSERTHLSEEGGALGTFRKWLCRQGEQTEAAVSGRSSVAMRFYLSCSPIYITLQKPNLIILDHIPNYLKKSGFAFLENTRVFLFEVNESNLHVAGGKRAPEILLTLGFRLLINDTLSYFHELNNKRAYVGHTPGHTRAHAHTHTHRK